MAPRSSTIKRLSWAPESWIPCSEVRIADGGERKIEEYYWEKELIERFVALRREQSAGRRESNADVTFIADRCCGGDKRWAREIIKGFHYRCTLSGE